MLLYILLRYNTCHPAAEPWPIHGGRRQPEIVLSHFPFDESQLAEDGGEFESESFLDLFLFAKRLEGCSDRSIFYYEATTKKTARIVRYASL